MEVVVGSNSIAWSLFCRRSSTVWLPATPITTIREKQWRHWKCVAEWKRTLRTNRCRRRTEWCWCVACQDKPVMLLSICQQCVWRRSSSKRCAVTNLRSRGSFCSAGQLCSQGQPRPRNCCQLSHVIEQRYRKDSTRSRSLNSYIWRKSNTGHGQ